MHQPDDWRLPEAASYRSYVKGPSRTDHLNLYVRLDYLVADLAPLEDHLGFRVDVGHENASARDRDYRAYYTNDLCDQVARICADDIGSFSMPFRHQVQKPTEWSNIKGRP